MSDCSHGMVAPNMRERFGNRPTQAGVLDALKDCPGVRGISEADSDGLETLAIQTVVRRAGAASGHLILNEFHEYRAATQQSRPPADVGQAPKRFVAMCVQLAIYGLKPYDISEVSLRFFEVCDGDRDVDHGGIKVVILIALAKQTFSLLHNLDGNADCRVTEADASQPVYLDNGRHGAYS